MAISIRKPAASDSEKLRQLALSCQRTFGYDEFLEDLRDEHKSLLIAEEEKIVAFGLAEEIRVTTSSCECPHYELIQTKFLAKEAKAQEAEKQFISYWLAEAKTKKIKQFFVKLVD